MPVRSPHPSPGARVTRDGVDGIVPPPTPPVALLLVVVRHRNPDACDSDARAPARVIERQTPTRSFVLISRRCAAVR